MLVNIPSFVCLKVWYTAKSHFILVREVTEHVLLYF